MHWARCIVDGRIEFGTIEGDRFRRHVGDMFGQAEPTADETPLSEVSWLIPCVPQKFLGLWNNFHAAAERNGWPRPDHPLYFVKTPNSYHPHSLPIPLPDKSAGRVAYEGELGIVIGRTVCRADPVEAEAAIFGYTCVNDLTAFDLFGEVVGFSQWTRAKSRDGFGVFGPVIATDLDLTAARVRTIVGGTERQNYPVSDMIIKPRDIVSLISRDMTLVPGDLIACGTSLGVSVLEPGAEVTVVIDGIGRLTNRYGAAGTKP